MSLRAQFFSHIANTSPFPLGLEIVKADGVYLFDPAGKKYIDFISGIGVNNLGHAHPDITKAIHNQADDYLHTMVYGEHIQSPQVRLAQKLTENLPINLNKVFFLTSGAEAIDGAIKTARKSTGRKKIYAFKNAYHGSTYGAMSLMNDASKTSPYGPGIADVFHFDFNDLTILENIDHTTAAVIMEVVQAEAGVIKADSQFLDALAKKCREMGSLLVFDEIQTGMGRTGSLFAFDQYGITPDILVLGKSLGGGLPLSAMVSSTKITDAIATNPPLTHMSTFGGHPLCCAAGLASLDLLLRSDLITRSKTLSLTFLQKIKDHPQIKEIRSTSGLWMAIELHHAERVQKLIPLAQEKGLLIDWFLFNDKSLRIAPPLTINNDEILLAADILLDCFDHLS